MKENTSWVIANVDLDDAVFAALSPRIPDLAKIDNAIFGIDSLGGIAPTTALGLVLLFKRRIDPGMHSVSPALAALGRCEKTFEETQLKQRIHTLHLIDCSEMPNAPLSHFTVLSHYLESLVSAIPAASACTVACLDYDLGQDDLPRIDHVRYWDTRSDEFVKHMQQYMIESLQTLNFDFGMGANTD